MILTKMNFNPTCDHLFSARNNAIIIDPSYGKKSISMRCDSCSNNYKIRLKIHNGRCVGFCDRCGKEFNYRLIVEKIAEV